MATKPILFSGPMVRAILEGRKTQTRRIIKGIENDNTLQIKKPTKTKMGVITHVIDAPKHGLLQHAIGDLLWVRETWAQIEEVECGCSEICGCPQVGEVRYRATVGDDERRWRPSIFMPRQHSRITLEVTGVRVELLQKISAADAVSEGMQLKRWITGIYPEHDIGVERENEILRDKFRSLWNSLNEKRGYGWDANPWVSVTEFKVHKSNVDDFVKEAG
ncbi:hypothetical protein GCM10007094_23200 [Pseudovibrio japonicus]|uniref:ASCH domain-containing protein n=1 Tax=Pseudovibrio japonicus TaxID=366534 RepID=A0ABQ3EED5_9HYPH|nr:hypothetical protein [Pseudovibrio japonicus]GHB33727.1 hypothetical protein GCM10007094_23200 [Pseudovibrio japonicus]